MKKLYNKVKYEKLGKDKNYQIDMIILLYRKVKVVRLLNLDFDVLLVVPN